jgi:hypothetical protein
MPSMPSVFSVVVDAPEMKTAAVEITLCFAFPPRSR